MNVVLLSDFSKVASHMMEYAAIFFKNQAVNFTIVHIKSPCKSGNCSGKCSIIFSQKLKTQQEFLVSKGYKEENVKTLFIEGSFIESIRNLITQQQADLIMLGNSNKEDLSNDLFFDKKTLEIITKVKCSVVLVPEKAKLKLPETALLPTDFSVTSQYSIFNILNSLSFINQINLSILSKKINKSIENSKLQKKNLIFKVIQSLNFKSVEIKESNSKLTCINGFGLVIVMAKNLSIFKDLFSISTDSSCLPKAPILFLHDSIKI